MDELIPDEPAPKPSDDRESVLVSARPEYTTPRLYLVLDDVGQTLQDLSSLSTFPAPLTLAVLPGLPYSRESVRQTLALGHEVILHQPMEALNGEDPGPGAIYLSQSEQDIRDLLLSNLSAHPEIRGVNNHMGSRITSNSETMEVILSTLKEHNYFFLDSRTIHTSVVSEVGSNLEMPILVRHVFLDHDRTSDAIEEQLDLALARARSRGYVIMIGHVTVPETWEVLHRRAAEIIEEGFSFLPLSDAFIWGDIGGGNGFADTGY